MLKLYKSNNYLFIFKPRRTHLNYKDYLSGVRLDMDKSEYYFGLWHYKEWRKKKPIDGELKITIDNDKFHYDEKKKLLLIKCKYNITVIIDIEDNTFHITKFSDYNSRSLLTHNLGKKIILKFNK